MGLKIRYLEDDGLYAPSPFCDVCGEAILDGGLALYCWRLKRDTLPEDDDTFTLVMSHKGDCHHTLEDADRQAGYRHMDMELGMLPAYLAANLNLTPEQFRMHVKSNIDELSRRIEEAEKD